jgi:hypothetical protein
MGRPGGNVKVVQALKRLPKSGGINAVNGRLLRV